MGLVLAFGLSYGLGLVIIWLARKGKFFLDDKEKSHGVHKEVVPRIGGLGIFLASLLLLRDPLGGKIVLAGVPAFLAGFFEDLISGIAPRVRLTIMTFSAILGVQLLGATVNDLEAFRIPYFLTVPLTLFLMVGVTNAINIIDGLNGLASGFCSIALIVFAVAGHWSGDTDFALVLSRLIFPIMGFFVLNYPRAQMFLGDSGAYFLGFVTVQAGLLLIHRNPEISRFFPLLVLFYPIWEVLFSIFRRRFYKKFHATAADRLHLHTLLYKRTNFSNPMAASLILIGVGILSLFGLALFHRSLPQLIGIGILVFFYHTIYKILVSFQVKTKEGDVVSLDKFRGGKTIGHSRVA